MLVNDSLIPSKIGPSTYEKPEFEIKICDELNATTRWADRQS